MLRCFADGHVSLGAVVWSPLRITLVVKAAYHLQGGTFELEHAPRPLSLDTFDEAGEIVYPTDFAPYKPACDVVVGGAFALDRRNAGTLVVGTLRRDVEANESLGPRESFCPAGDPSDAEAHASWVSGAMEPARFQCVGPRQRMPWPEGAMQIELSRPPVTLSAAWHAAFPSVVVEAPGGARGAVAAPLDTIVLMPSESRMVVLWRAILDAPTGGEHVVYVQLVSPGAAGSYREVAPTLPASLRTTQVEVVADPMTAQAVEATVAVRGAPQFAWPFQGARDLEPRTAPPTPPVDVEHTRTAAFRTLAKTLPFQQQGGGATATPPRNVAHHEISALRAEGQKPTRPAWQADEGTVSLARPEPVTSPPYAPPAPLPVAVSPAFVAAPLASEPPREVMPPERLAPVIAPSSSPPVDAAAGDRERVASIQREIWKGERRLADILAGHGLTEAGWRELRRRSGKAG